jgi:peptidyl-prolyl cis-trans isomerase D
MLSLMRKHAQSWIIKIALFAVAIVFVFWGVGSFRSERAARVATVNGKTITQSEFQQAYQQYLGRLQDAGGGRLDEKLLKEMKVKEKVLDSIVDQRLLTQLGKDLGFSVTRDELIHKIQQIPAFQEKGRFDSSKYQRLLQMNRINSETFEAEQSEQIMLGRIQTFLNDFVKVDPEEVRNFYAYLSDEIDLYLIRFDPETYRKKLQPTAEQLQAFFAKNQGRYQTPVQVRVGFPRRVRRPFRKKSSRVITSRTARNSWTRKITSLSLSNRSRTKSGRRWLGNGPGKGPGRRPRTSMINCC